MHKNIYLSICLLLVLATFSQAQKNVFSFTKDVGVVSLDTAQTSLQNAVIPRTIIKNFGTSVQSFNVQLKIGNYYISTQNINNLSPDSSIKVFFDTLWTVEKGCYDLVCYTMLNGDENHTNDTISWYLSYGRWSQFPSVPIPLAGTREVVLYNGDSTCIYSFGGTYYDSLYGLGMEKCYRYNYESENWTKLADIPYRVLRHTASRVGNNVYVVGGEEMDVLNPNIYDTISVYNIETNSWSIASFKMPGKIVDASSTVYADSLIYIINGTSFPTSVQLSYVICPNDKIIKPINNCPGSHAAVAAWNNRLICFSDSGIFSADINPSHPENITWIKKADANIQFDSYCSANPWGNKIICLARNMLFLYDPVYSSVTKLSMPVGFTTSGGEITCARNKNGKRDYIVLGYDGQYKYSETESLTAVENEQKISPDNYILSQNYPNPFNPATKIRFNLPVQSNVKIRVYDMLGREVSVLANNQFGAGEHEVSFNGASLSSGIYVYRIEAAGINGKSFNAVKKMILLK
jgi:hypothetical protein